MLKAPDQCPTCHEVLSVRELGCPACGTIVRGNWSAGPFAQLSSDQQAFLILFVRSRGNLSEVERALGVSYPTVRAKLEEVIQVFEQEPASTGERRGGDQNRREILDRVARGEISASEGLSALRQRGESADE